MARATGPASGGAGMTANTGAAGSVTFWVQTISPDQ